MIQRTHVGLLPHKLIQPHVYQRSKTSFTIVVPTAERELNGDNSRVTGSMMYFTLAPCSASRSALGVLGVQVAAPTHIPTTGRKIARRTRATSPYNLGIKVVWGRESGYEKLNWTTRHVDKSVGRINYFDPYAGQVIVVLEEHDAKRYSVNYVVLDYASPWTTNTGSSIDFLLLYWYPQSSTLCDHMESIARSFGRLLL